MPWKSVRFLIWGSTPRIPIEAFVMHPNGSSGFLEADHDHWQRPAFILLEIIIRIIIQYVNKRNL